MLQLLQHHQIQKDKWDALIKHSQTPLIYGLSWYLDIVAPGWCAIVNEDYSIGFPVYLKKKMFIPYAIQPIWTQRLGFFSTHSITDEVMKQTFSILQKNALWWSFRMNANFNLSLLNKNVQISQHHNYELSLKKPFDELWHQFSQNLKRNLKKSFHMQQNITQSEQVDRIIHIFQQHRGKQITGLHHQAYETLRMLIQEARRRNMAIIYTMHDNTGVLIAGAIFLVFHNRAILCFSGVDTLAKKFYPLHNLIVHFIRNHHNEYSILDFEGSDNPNLARFYSQFGAINVPYIELYYNKLPFSNRIVHCLRKIF